MEKLKKCLQLIKCNESCQFIMNNSCSSSSKINRRKSKKKLLPSQKSQSASLFSETFPIIMDSIKSQFLQDNSSYQEDPIKKLYDMQKQIDIKMVKLDELNGQYYDKQEKLFLKTFLNMMDRMSNQLLEFKQRYNNIDQEIDNLPQCVKLRQKLSFFKQQCLFLSTEAEKAQKQLQQLKIKNKKSQIQNQKITNQLLSQIKKQKKYRQRKYSLQTKLDCHEMTKYEHFKDNQTKRQSKIKNKTRRSLSSRDNQKIHMKSSMQQVKQIPENKVIKRPMTSFNMYGKQSKQVQFVKNINISGYTQKDFQFGEPIDTTVTNSKQKLNVYTNRFNHLKKH